MVSQWGEKIGIKVVQNPLNLKIQPFAISFSDKCVCICYLNNGKIIYNQQWQQLKSAKINGAKILTLT